MRSVEISRRSFLRGATAKALALTMGAGVTASACTRVSLASEPDGGTLLERLRSAGEVRVGFANEAPYSYINSEAELTGEAAELAKVIFKRLGVEKLVPIPSDFGALISGLKVGLFDVIGAGMSITPTRCEQVLFTDPEFIAPAAFLVTKGNPRNVRTFQDVAANRQLRLGVLIGAVERDYAIGNGVDPGQITPFADQQSGLEGVLANRIDAFALTTISLRHSLSTRSDVPLEVTGPFFATIDGKEQFSAGGFAFLPDQTTIVREFNTVLADLQRSGELLDILKPFGFTQAEMTDLTAEDLCRPAA